MGAFVVFVRGVAKCVEILLPRVEQTQINFRMGARLRVGYKNCNNTESCKSYYHYRRRAEQKLPILHTYPDVLVAQYQQGGDDTGQQGE